MAPPIFVINRRTIMYMIQDSDSRLYPADRCTFHIVYDTDTNEYVISTASGNVAMFYPGNAAAIALSNNSSERPVLGVIGGRTGRFAPITGR